MNIDTRMWEILTDKQKAELSIEYHKKLLEQVKAIKITKQEIYIDIQQDIDDIVTNGLDRVDYDKIAKQFTQILMKGLK